MRSVVRVLTLVSYSLPSQMVRSEHRRSCVLLAARVSYCELKSHDVSDWQTRSLVVDFGTDSYCVPLPLVTSSHVVRKAQTRSLCAPGAVVWYCSVLSHVVSDLQARSLTRLDHGSPAMFSGSHSPSEHLLRSEHWRSRSMFGSTLCHCALVHSVQSAQYRSEIVEGAADCHCPFAQVVKDLHSRSLCVPAGFVCH